MSDKTPSPGPKSWLEVIPELGDMRARIYALATPPRDDFDRAVLLMLGENDNLRAEIERLRAEWKQERASKIAAAEEIEGLTAALRDVVSALDTLGIDGWSEAPHLMRVCRAALEEGK